MNIILVMSDTYRHDNLSVHGPTVVKTPRLDAFAKEACVFQNAYLGSFPTLPNRLDIMSGRFIAIDHDWCPLPKETVTLQQILGASGCVTRLIADNPHLIEMGYNYDRGFDSWEWIRGQETDVWRTIPKGMEMPPRPETYSTREFILRGHMGNTAWWTKEEDRFTARSIRSACDWLEENQDQNQFFLSIDMFDPHEPWDAPRKYIDMYDPDCSDQKIAYPDYCFWREKFSEKEMADFRTMYRAEASMIDNWFGVLLDKLDALGMADDTAVIFTSDHGYLFGEHDIIGKSLMYSTPGQKSYEGIPMYDEIRRVPLMIRVPGLPKGLHSQALVQSPDLMPTVLELAGLLATEHVGGQSQTQALQCGVFFTSSWEFKPETIHGKSLLPVLRGETDRHRNLVVSSNSIIHHNSVLAKSAIVTEDGWCLHYTGSYAERKEAQLSLYKVLQPESARLSTAPMLFNIREDPHETNDLIDSHPELAADIHARYVKWLEEMGTPEEHLSGRRQLR